MTTTAATWFYHAPETRPYLLAERVRTSFWDQRFGNLWLETDSAVPPLAMSGTCNGSAIKLNWEPGRWLRLTTQPEAPSLAGGVTNLLQNKPLFRYTDLDGSAVWEWWISREDGEQRWQAVQGKPAFGSPARLK